MRPADGPAANVGPADVLGILRRRWLVIVCTVAVVTGLALAFSLTQKKQYAASSRVLVRTVAADATAVADPNVVAPFYADRQLKNAVQVILSTDVRAAVAAEYHGKLDVHDVDAVATTDGSDVIDLSVTGPDPVDAADLVNLYARVYISNSAKTRTDAFLSAEDTIRKQISALDDERAKLSAPLDDVNAKLAASPDNTGLQQQSKQLSAEITPQIQALDSQRGVYVQRLQTIQLSVGLAGVEGASLITQADPPNSPVSPKPVRDGIVGLMLGLGLGVAAALGREFLDESIRTVTDIERITGGSPATLGVVPVFAGTGEGVVSIERPASIEAEAFRALRTSVRFLALDGTTKVIEVTSSRAGEGKTTVAANLGAVLVQAGYRVVVVSCDLRKPELHKHFGESLTPGLTDVLLGEASVSEAIRLTSSGVYLVSSGSRPPNPSELLGSARTKVMLDFLASEFDFVIVDSPPVLSITDAVVVSQFVHATLVVVAARQTSGQQLRETLDVLSRAGAPVMGAVLNRASAREHGYEYLYSEEFDRPSSGVGRSIIERMRARA